MVRESVTCTELSDGFDTVCPYQADVHERGWQVQLMREIYVSAKQVIAFVGVALLEQAKPLLK